jgi:Cu2+-exporting ATPase
VFLAPQIDGVVLAPGATPAIELRFDATRYSQRQVLEHVAALLDAGEGMDGAEAAPDIVKLAPLGYPKVPPAVTARDRHGVIRYQRCAQRVTGWQIVSERVGAIKLENPVIYRKSVLCEAIERELMSVLGVDRYETSSRLLGLCRVRSAPARPGPDHRDPGRCTGQRRISRAAR